jgi:hypothetical protein
MLSWMTPRLAAEAAADTARAARERRNTATAGGQPHKATSRSGSGKHHRRATKHHAPVTKRHA